MQCPGLLGDHSTHKEPKWGCSVFSSQSCCLLRRQLQVIFGKGEGQKVPVTKYCCMGCAVMESSSVEMHSLNNPLSSRAQTQDNLIPQPEKQIQPSPDFGSFGSKFRFLFPLWLYQQCSDLLYLAEGITSQMLISALEKSLETKRQQESRRLSYH